MQTGYQKISDFESTKTQQTCNLKVSNYALEIIEIKNSVQLIEVVQFKSTKKTKKKEHSFIVIKNMAFIAGQIVVIFLNFNIFNRNLIFVIKN